MERNPSQKRAIAHLSGPMMVLAGPGSGKTSVIVERTAYMIRERHIQPSSILVVTFSKAAATEMKERFLAFMGQESSPVTFGTFHGVFYGILKHAYGLGAGNILSGEEKYGILKELSMEYGQEAADGRDFQEDLAREISLVKGNRIALEHYYSTSCADEVFRQIYTGYQKAIRAKRKLDFDDMLVCCYELFKKRPDILAGWRQKFRYIMVDEFQDINLLQYDIVRMLAAPSDNLFIVGDDDQSIYHFRGARPEIMLNFQKDYPKSERVLLDVNYRCSGSILGTAMELIGHNKRRFTKQLSTPNAQGQPVAVREYQNPREECLELSQLFKKRLDRGENLEDTAVLFRTNQEAEGLVRALMEYQVPFIMKEQLPNLFRHWISRDFLAYQELAAGNMSRQLFLQVMNHPNRYISREALAQPQVSLEALRVFYKDKDWMCDRITTLETHLRILKSLAPFAAINFIRKGMQYDVFLQDFAKQRGMRPEELLEVADRVQESAGTLTSLDAWRSYMEEYSQRLLEQARRQEGKREGVTISTLHGSKGLEYDRVYILNVNEECIPYRRAVLEEALEEERRLFYVGLTRAKRELVLAYVRKQFEKDRAPSRFLAEAGLCEEDAGTAPRV